MRNTGVIRGIPLLTPRRSTWRASARQRQAAQHMEINLTVRDGEAIPALTARRGEPVVSFIRHEDTNRIRSHAAAAAPVDATCGNARVRVVASGG